MFAYKKNTLVVLITLLAITIMILSIGLYPANAEIDEENNMIRVIVGDLAQSDNYSTKNNQKQLTASPNTYQNERKALLQSLDMEANYSAVLLFNDYYKINEVEDFILDAKVELERVYMWIPNNTGRLILNVSNNDITNSLSDFIAQMEQRPQTDMTFNSDFRKLKQGEFKIFSITAKATAETFINLSEHELLSMIDVKYNPEAEAEAARSNTSVSYIELPSKPDGAL